MNCPNCNAENKNAAKFCISCGTPLVQDIGSDGSVRQKKVQSYAQGKNPTVAVILSLLLVGAGQFYNGDRMKGAVMLVGAIIFAPILLATVIGLFIFPIWSMIDAYNVAKGNWKKWA